MGAFAAPLATTAAQDLGIGDPLDPALGNPGYDVASYVLDLAWSPETGLLDASTTIEARATAALESINLDFVGFDIESVQVDGAPATFERGERDLVVSPSDPIAEDATFEVRVDYGGEPTAFASASGVFVPLAWNVGESGTTFVVSDPDGARGWFPSNDHPTDKATITFRLTAPDDLLAVANWVLVEQRPIGDGRITSVWRMDQPMATYLATVVIGAYDLVTDEAGSEVAGVPIRNVLPRDDSAGFGLPTDDLALQGEMLRFFADLVGPYPFEGYGIAYVPEMPAALETQSLSIVGIPFEEVLAHELAHQWFGDDVSVASWQDVWLKVGFATYLTWMWLDHTGAVPMWASVEAALAAGEMPPPADPTMGDLYSRSIYDRGALALHALRTEMGDEGFRTLLRTWVERFGGGSAATDDLVALANEVSGRDLGPLLDAWLSGDTMPELAAS
jgi:aminopeptidase N